MEEIKEERAHKDDRNDHSEDPEILDIVKSIEGRRPEALRVPGEEPCTIYQVSKILHQVNEKCYEPRLFSVGPYHHGKDRLKLMEGKKFEHLLAILSRNPKLKLKDYVREIKELEAKARKCYSESITLQSKEFVEMMVFDGCFLVEIFIQNHTTKINDERLSFFMSHDMLLLENQLPFFVLERIFSLVVPKERPGLMKDLLLGCFESVLPLNKDAAAKESYHHLLDMLHHHCLPTHYADKGMKGRPDPPPNTALAEADRDTEAQYNAKQGPDMQRDPEAQHKAKQGRAISIRSAEELQFAGIEFQRKDAKPAGSFLDVKFDKQGVLKIPFLYFSDNLQTLVQNLTAYEQCNTKVGTFFTGYALFMDDLINTAKDVQILRRAGILERGFGSDEELAQLFNQWRKGIFYSAKDTHLYKERMDINQYCGSPTLLRLLRRQIQLWRHFFGRPEVLVGVWGIYMAILQTITSASPDSPS